MDPKTYVANVLNWENKDTDVSKRQIELYLKGLPTDVYDNSYNPLVQKCMLYNLELTYRYSYWYSVFFTDHEFIEMIRNPDNFDKWFVYNLISTMMTGEFNLLDYYRLLILLDAERDEEIGRKEKLLTEECFVDYPPILQFFRACSGEIVLYNETPITPDISCVLISMEIPYAIINYVEFDPLSPHYSEELGKLRVNYDTDEDFISYLKVNGYTGVPFNSEDGEKWHITRTIKSWPTLTSECNEDDYERFKGDVFLDTTDAVSDYLLKDIELYFKLVKNPPELKISSKNFNTNWVVFINDTFPNMEQNKKFYGDKHSGYDDYEGILALLNPVYSSREY